MGWRDSCTSCSIAEIPEVVQRIATRIARSRAIERNGLANITAVRTIGVRCRCLHNWDAQARRTAVRARVVRAASSCCAASHMRFVILWCSGVVGILILARLVVVDRLDSQAAVIGIEGSVDCGRPLPLHADTGSVRREAGLPLHVLYPAWQPPGGNDKLGAVE